MIDKEKAIEILRMNEQERWRSGITVEEEKEAIDMAIEALKTEIKKCPICGSDLYEYCFMCCYDEGKRVIKSE